MIDFTTPPSDRVPYKEDARPSDSPERKAEGEKIFEGTRSYMDNLDYHKTAEFFDIAYDDRRDTNLYEKVEFIREWASQQSESKDAVDGLSKINELRKKLGLSVKGKELVVKLYRYIRLSVDKDRIEKEMKLALS